jgi:hypothetical protein
MFFSFTGKGVSLPRAALDYFLRGWIVESCLVHDAHLFLLQFHTVSFGAGWQGEIALLFSVQHSIGNLSMD